jgi:hypothetical protein
VDGSSIKSLRELAEKLQEISDETFSYHCNSKKNDFFSWIKDVFADVELANKVKSVYSRQEMIWILVEYLGK